MSFSTCLKKVSLCFILGSLSLHGESLSGKSPYPSFCQLAAEDDAVFANFKRHPVYQNILEHVSYELGHAYLDIIQEDYREALALFEKFRENDAIGNPETFEYDDFGDFSPTTLRYIKVAYDLKKRFGSLKNLNIVEIGGGYGGLCKIIHDMGGFASYTLIDLPECNALSKKYLDCQGINNVSFIANTDISQAGTYDLVISNYAFSEISEDEQRDYLDYIVTQTPCGYMTMNFISHHFDVKSISSKDLIRLLGKSGKKGYIVKERPLSHPDNVLITWMPSNFQKPKEDPKKIPIELKKAGLQEGNAITYDFSGGRLGDNLMSYLHAKWLSYKYGLPLLYRRFDQSQFFRLDDLEPKKEFFIHRFTSNILDESDLKAPLSSTLFTLPYFPECKMEYEHLQLDLPYCEVDWEDPEFKKIVKKMLSPKKRVKTIDLPKNEYVTVGMHVRRGGGLDSPHSCNIWPLKFAPDSYYIEQVKYLKDIFKGKKLFVYLLTDDWNPQALIQRYAREVNDVDVAFACRPVPSGPNHNILEDFFVIPKFDCMILSQSNFCLTASKLGNYQMKITPLHCIKEDGKWVVDEVEIFFNKLN